MRISAKFTSKTLVGDLLKNNPKTVVMRLDGGRVVKRHKRKHSVEVG